MRDINRIVIHCSDSSFGDAALIRSWHLERGFADIGYHFVIQNGHPRKTGEYSPALDGKLEAGRDLKRVGAHVYGHNKDSVGICLVGKDSFTLRQMETLKEEVDALRKRFSIPTMDVLGHCELDLRKTCPNLSMDRLRAYLDEPWEVAA